MLNVLFSLHHLHLCVSVITHMKWMNSHGFCLWVSIPYLFSMLSICGGLSGTYFSSVSGGSSIHSHPQPLSCFCTLLRVTPASWPDMCRSPVAQRLSMFHHDSLPVLVPMRITLGPRLELFPSLYSDDKLPLGSQDAVYNILFSCGTFQLKQT